MDGLRLQSTAHLRAGAWQGADRHELTTPNESSGPSRTDQVSDLIVTVVASSDGTSPLGEQLARLAEQLGIGCTELQAAAVPAITQLIEHHIIEPAAD